ncbi:MAG: GNAT family N-acetyltransferase [Ktedonobacterales bacterium]
MTPTLRVELATQDDLATLGQLRVAVGWLPNGDLLRALWPWDRARIFVVREATLTAGGSAVPIATTCATATDGIGVIGNVHVRSDYQRRGLGRLLMEVALGWQREQGVQSVYLDATAEGRPLYTKLGFVGLERSWAVHAPLSTLDLGVLATLARPHTDLRIAYSSADEMQRLADLDSAAYGADRLELLARLLALPNHALLTAEDSSGQMLGYLLTRLLEPPAHGVRVGPWVARNSGIAATLLAAALAEDAPWRTALAATITTADAVGPLNISISLPTSSAPAFELLAAISAPLEEDDLIMRLDFTAGATIAPAAPASVYAWLAPMVF